MADRIVQVKVLTARVEPHPDYKNLKTLVLTLQVEDVLKGRAAKTLTLRQFIWDLRDISDAAGYRSGDEVLLFLNRPTAMGLTSPVGLEQGRFQIQRTRSGELVAMNGAGNSGLLRGVVGSHALNTAKLTAQSRSTVEHFSEGRINLEALKETVHVMVTSPAGAR